MSQNFALPGIEKIDSFKLVFNEGIDNDIKLLAQLSKFEITNPNPGPLREVELRLNKLEQVGSLFSDPVKDFDDRNISQVTIDDQRIQIPDVQINFHHNSSTQQIQDGSLPFEATDKLNPVGFGQEEAEAGERERRQEPEIRQNETDIREIVII